MLGVRTTYRSGQPLPPVPVDPFPKDGLAISGGVPLEPIESVSRYVAGMAGDGRVAAEGVQSRRGRDHQAACGSVGAVASPDPGETRQTLPVRLESWYRSPSGEPGWTVSYVEAVRQYPPGPDDKGCGLETLVSGWLHHRDGKLMEGTQLRAKLTYCDRVGATYMLPFGRIRPKEQTYWVFQLSGWESEWYEVVCGPSEKGPLRPRSLRAGGARARCR